MGRDQISGGGQQSRYSDRSHEGRTEGKAGRPGRFSGAFSADGQAERPAGPGERRGCRHGRDLEEGGLRVALFKTGQKLRHGRADGNAEEKQRRRHDESGRLPEKDSGLRGKRL